MREKYSNVEMVLLKEKSELIKILPIIRSDEYLLIPTKVNRVNMFKYNHLFKRFKVKLEIEISVKYALLSIQNNISGIEKLYSHKSVDNCFNLSSIKF